MFKKPKSALILPVLILTSVFTSCSIDPSGNKKHSSAPSIPGEISPTLPGSSDGTALGSLEAFQQTVYPLVREVTCAGCHATIAAPFFASDDPEESHNAVVVASKVDLVNPESSRLVQRLANDAHNCWSQDCQADSEEMLAAVTMWAELMDNKDDSSPELKTHTLTLADAVPKENNPTNQGTIILEAEEGNLTAPMTVENDGNTSGGQYIQVPNGNGGFIRQPNTANIGIVTYDFEVTEAGTYRLWGLVQSVNTNDDSYYVRIDNGNFRTWQTAITGNNWQWDLATDQNNGGNIHEFNLAPGIHRLEIRRRQDGAKLDAIALTTDLNFTGADPEPETINILRFDLEDLVGQSGVYLEIEVSEFDNFSYKFKNPTIVSESTTLTVSNLKVLLNDKYNPQHSTYTYIDTEVRPPGAILSSAALIMPNDIGFSSDQISISFQTLRSK